MMLIAVMAIRLSPRMLMVGAAIMTVNFILAVTRERHTLILRACLPIALIAVLSSACSASTPPPTPSPLPTIAPTLIPTRAPTPVPLPTPTPTPLLSRGWTEEEVTFSFGSDELFGVVTLPTGEGPFPAIVLVSGSVSTSTGVRDGVLSGYHIDHARKLAGIGYAVLRYDPPGVGRSSGRSGFEPLDMRADEAHTALSTLQSRPDITPDRVGLWGISQGGWVIAMAAARYPEDVAFIISVSGSGVSVAEQQIYSIEAQSTKAGFPDEDVAKAALFGRLLIDWQLAEPIYRERNQTAVQTLGDGPWLDFMRLVYEPGEITPAQSLQGGIAIFRSIQDDPWAKYLYLKELYLPQLESIPPEQVAALRAATGPNLLNDPREYVINVRCPVLAFFGADDLLQPSDKSAALYEQYLTEAGNEAYRIVVIPGVGHEIYPWMSAYWDVLAGWLGRLYAR